MASKKKYDYGYDFNFPRGYDPGLSKDADQYYFCEDTFYKYIQIIESCCFHYKGDLTGTPLILEKFQRDFIAALFCLKNKDTHHRRYTKALLYIPRKNGKSLLIAALMLAYMIIDTERGKEVISAAGSRDQAKLVYNPVKYSIKHPDSPLNSPYNANPSTKFKIYANPAKIISENEETEYNPITADADRQHGLNPSFACCDELHTWSLTKGLDLLEAIDTAQGARSQPLIAHITTADRQGDTLCNREFNFAKEVCEGKKDMPFYLPVLYYLEDTDDWKDEDNWKIVNPNYDVMNRRKFQIEFQEALDNPVKENSFKRLRLNIQTTSEVQFLDYNRWLNSPNVNLELLKGMECCGGLDLAYKTDLCAFVLEFAIEDKYHILQWFWIPENHESIEFYRENGWLDLDSVRTTQGDVIDFKQLKSDIVEILEDYSPIEIGFDPRFATELCQSLYDDYDIPMVEVPQTTRYLSEPLKDIAASIISDKFVNDSCPFTAFQVGNATAKVYDDQNIKLIKPSGSDRTYRKVDFIAALSIAHNRTLFNKSIDVNKELRAILEKGGSIL